MFAPFKERHEKAFEGTLVSDIINSIPSDDKNALKTFAKACIDYALNQKVDEDFKDLAIDTSICTRDFRSVLKLTEDFARTEYYLYRAYAYSRQHMANKIVSLKLQFQQKYTDALDNARNAFITASMEFLLLYGEQNYTMALTTIEEIEQLLAIHPDELEHKLFTLLILTLGCQAYLQVNNFDKVEIIARRILQSAVSMDDPYFQSVALNLITTVLINKGEFRKAQSMMNAAIIPADKTGLNADRASLLNNSAKLELARGDYEKSVRLLEQIYDLVSSNPRAQAISAINIAELYILLHEIDAAEKMLETALLLDKGHNLRLIEPYLLTAWIAIESNGLEKAQEYLEISKQKLDETGEIRKLPNILYFEGLLSKRKNDIDKAIEHLEEANRKAAELRNIELLIKTQLQLAGIYLARFNATKELADYSSVLSYLDNLTYISEEQFIPRLMCDLHLIKGLLLSQSGKKDRAIESINKAYDQASKFNYKQMQKEANRLLKKVEDEKKEEFDELEELKQKGFADADRMTEVLQKYEGFKFIKSPKQVEAKLYGLAIVEAETAVIKYRYITEHEVDNAASLVPTVVAAVGMYSKSVLEEEVLLSEVKEEDTELLIESIDDYLIVVIAEKITFGLKLQFEHFIDILAPKLKEIAPVEATHEHEDYLNKIIEHYFIHPDEFQQEEDIPVPVRKKVTKEEEAEAVRSIPTPGTKIPAASQKQPSTVDRKREQLSDIDDDILELDKAVTELEETIQYADLEGISPEIEGELEEKPPEEVEEEPEVEEEEEQVELVDKDKSEIELDAEIVDLPRDEIEIPLEGDVIEKPPEDDVIIIKEKEEEEVVLDEESEEEKEIIEEKPDEEVDEVIEEIVEEELEEIVEEVVEEEVEEKIDEELEEAVEEIVEEILEEDEDVKDEDLEEVVEEIVEELVDKIVEKEEEEEEKDEGEKKEEEPGYDPQVFDEIQAEEDSEDAKQTEEDSKEVSEETEEDEEDDDDDDDFVDF